MISKIFVMFVPLVFAVTDPTTICLPDQVSFYSYDIQTDVISFVTLDYKQKLMAAVTGNTSVVNDLANGKSYATDATGSCQSSDLVPRDPYPQCLPANAVPIGNIYIGFGSNTLNATGWTFPYNNGVVKIGFTNDPNAPNVPIISRFVDEKGVLYSSFTADAVANLTQPERLKVPSPCPPKVIV
nr:hypothetical protein BgiMline_019050 [Biomphalaria glabrata]